MKREHEREREISRCVFLIPFFAALSRVIRSSELVHFLAPALDMMERSLMRSFHECVNPA